MLRLLSFRLYPLLKAGLSAFLFIGSLNLTAQTHFNAWLSSCSHLIGPTGNPTTLQIAINQSRGIIPEAPGFAWDIMIDVGDWTASQAPPDHEEGIALARCFTTTIGKDRGCFFSVSGNHDGEKKGWEPGEFTQKYVNPLGDPAFLKTSDFEFNQRPNKNNFRQLLDYPDTRWDRYLIRTGNVIWIKLGDRNEFDTLAESRGDTSGRFQAGRGSASGMPKGGYPSGSVTLDIFEWWKKVIEDPAFSEDILVTAHHLLPVNTTISTENGEAGDYHGKSGSIGPNGEIGGQLYWIREYDRQGKEINQYAQTRPFLNYLRDHPGAIAAWIGGHTHIDSPEAMINGRGISVRKYGVTFLSVGALTDSHAGGGNQMTRMLSFQNGEDEAIVNVYIHKSTDGHAIGWFEPAARRFPLGKPFICPDSSTSVGSPFPQRLPIENVPEAPAESPQARYHWNLNKDHEYDFNNERYVVGEDGSPYGKYEAIDQIVYSEDTPFGTGRSLDLRGTKGRVNFGIPYIPEMNWEAMTISLRIKTQSLEPQEVIGHGSQKGIGKFRLWYDGSGWVWEVGEGPTRKRASWETKDVNDGQWHHFVATVDGENDRIQLFVDERLVAEEEWKGAYMNSGKDYRLVMGNSRVAIMADGIKHEDHSFNGFIDELMIYDFIFPPLPIAQ